MTPEKRLQVAEIIATIALSATVLCSGVAYYFYDRWKFEQDRFKATEIQNSVYSNRSDTYQFNMQKRLNVSDTIITVLLQPQTKVIPVSGSEKGVAILNDSLKKIYLKAESDDSKKMFYQPVLKNKNGMDSLDIALAKGDFQEVGYRENVESVELIWK